MAHNLNFNNGKTSFVETKTETRAWHGLGQVVDGAMTSKEAIELGGLDYEVVKAPLVGKMEGVGDIEIPDNFATIRKDNNAVLGVVGGRYSVIQNKDAFVFFDSIVGAGQAIFHTAGALGAGEKIFVSAKMPNYIRIAGTDDVTEIYVILTSSHDGTGAVLAAITPVRVLCQNTLRLALKTTTNKVSIRHTKNAERNLCEAHKLLGITNDYVTSMNETFNALSLKRVSDEQVKTLIGDLFKGSGKEENTRSTNIQDEVLNSYFAGIGQDKILGTAYGVLQGVTHYTSHVKSYKDADTKFSNLIMDGAASKINDRALELLLAL